MPSSSGSLVVGRGEGAADGEVVVDVMLPMPLWWAVPSPPVVGLRGIRSWVSFDYEMLLGVHAGCRSRSLPTGTAMGEEAVACCCTPEPPPPPAVLFVLLLAFAATRQRKKRKQ